MERRNPFRSSGAGATRQASALSRVRHTPRSRAEERVWDETGALNPLRQAGRKAGPGSNRAASRERMFDKRGEVNGSDNRDILKQIAHLLKNVTPDASRQMFRSAARENAEQRTARMQIVAEAMRDPTGEGFAIVGQELLLPIKDQLTA